MERMPLEMQRIHLGGRYLLPGRKLRKSDAISLLPDGLGVILARVADEPAVRVWSRVLQHVRRIAINRASEALGGPVLVSVGGACFPRAYSGPS
jgi:hypothetical protein